MNTNFLMDGLVLFHLMEGARWRESVPFLLKFIQRMPLSNKALISDNYLGQRKELDTMKRGVVHFLEISLIPRKKMPLESYCWWFLG